MTFADLVGAAERDTPSTLGNIAIAGFACQASGAAAPWPLTPRLPASTSTSCRGHRANPTATSTADGGGSSEPTPLTPRENTPHHRLAEPAPRELRPAHKPAWRTAWRTAGAARLGAGGVGTQKSSRDVDLGPRSRGAITPLGWPRGGQDPDGCHSRRSL